LHEICEEETGRNSNKLNEDMPTIYDQVLSPKIAIGRENPPAFSEKTFELKQRRSSNLSEAA
jgi:hypothetical protein